MRWVVREGIEASEDGARVSHICFMSFEVFSIPGSPVLSHKQQSVVSDDIH